MSHPKDKNGAPPPDQTPSEETKNSGRVTFDSRGNAVWEWEVATGKFDQDVSADQLKKLEAPELSLDDTLVIGEAGEEPKADDTGKNRSQPIPTATPAPAKDKDPAAASGFNPYDRSVTVGGGFNPYDRLVRTKPEPKRQRRSIQSIVAEQRAKEKKP